MTENDKEFFKECLKHHLINPILLNHIIPNFSVQEYKDLQSEKEPIIDVTDEFKWNGIRNVIDKGMAELGYEFTELMSCIPINRYLMFEYLTNRKKRYDRGKRKRIPAAAFRQIDKELKEMERTSRSRINEFKESEL